jgi:hypothetical protein
VKVGPGATRSDTKPRDLIGVKDLAMADILSSSHVSVQRSRAGGFLTAV